MATRRFGFVCCFFWLLAGCRSERVAFEFQPAKRTVLPPDASSRMPSSHPVALQSHTSYAKPLLNVTGLVCQAKIARLRSFSTNKAEQLPLITQLAGITERVPPSPTFKAVRHKNAALAQPSHLPTVKVPATEPRTRLTWSSVLQPLGTVIAIGGIVLGVLLGGWLGLGVALLLLMLGLFIALTGQIKDGDLI